MRAPPSLSLFLGLSASTNGAYNEAVVLERVAVAWVMILMRRPFTSTDRAESVALFIMNAMVFNLFKVLIVVDKILIED